jgi:mannitol-1-phosphate 5-dehydrogenase
VIFGAGSVGRGFLGQLFCESGYEVVFVDIDRKLVEVLERQSCYNLCLLDGQVTNDITIGPVRALLASQTSRVAQEVARTNLMATAVGARALEEIAVPLAAGLAQRWEAGETQPANIIVCENAPGAPGVLCEAVREQLPGRFQSYLGDKIGFVPAIVARMSPGPTPEQRASDPTLITAEPYKELPVDRESFVGALPAIGGMIAVSPFSAYVQRKLFIHNAAHAMLGYLGFRRGHAYGHEALDDAWIRVQLDKAMDEASRALVKEHGFDSRSLQDHVQDVLARLANRALADPISRLCRDPLRKLGPNDRLVGAARLAEKHSITPVGLSWGIAAALEYDDERDPHAVELATRLSREGFEAVVWEVCRIGRHEALFNLVRARVCQLGNPRFRKDQHATDTRPRKH